MDSLLNVLKAACGQSPQEIKDAESQLKELQEHKGFYSALLDIYFCKDLDVNIRWMAILCFKNGVIRNWKRVSKNCISDDEKSQLRRKLIFSFNEDITQLAVQQAVVIGHIARSDVRQWPESIQRTLDGVKSEDSLVKHRALLTLNQIIKQLASKRLMADRKIFEEISRNLFDSLFEWSKHHITFIEDTNDQNELSQHYDLLILMTKISRNLIIQGSIKYSMNSPQIQYMFYCLQKVKVLIQRGIGAGDGILKEKNEKQVLLMMKIINDFLDTHSSSFVPLLEFSIQLCLEAIYMSNHSFERFTIICGNILQTIVKTFKKKNSDNENKEAIEIVKKNLTITVIENLASYIIMNHFTITPTDMDEWMNAPEEFMLVEAGESHKFLLKPCMETLFLGLFYSFKSIIIPLVIKYVNEIQSVNISNLNQNTILQVAAVYKAVGLASYEIFNDLDFDKWFEMNLLPILFNDTPQYLLLRQHIIWLVGEWVNVSFSKANRIKLYNFIAMVLSTSHTDLVMKLTACKTLRTAIDDFDFSTDDFTPYINTIFIAAVNLLVSVELCDTKMNILNLLSIMIERIGNKVRENANLLLEYLPKLWKISEAHNLLRGAVVNVLTHLVKGLESDSKNIQYVTLPIILYSTAIDQEAHIYLLEDALELWVAVLEASENMNEDLLKLYSNIIPLMERASETFETCLNITTLYISLDSQTFFEHFGMKICELFLSFIGNIREESCVKVLQVFRLAIQRNSTLTKDIFHPCLLQICEIMLKDESYCVLTIEIITIFGYILLYHPFEFQKILETCHEKMQVQNFEQFMGKFLDIWLEKVDYMALIEKKISAMALISLLPQKAMFIFERFGLILDFCVNVLYDLRRENGDDIIDDSLVVTHDESLPRDGSSQLKDKSYMDDPVYSVTLVNFVQKKLKETQDSYGEQMFQEGMETLDKQVAKQLQSIL